MFDHMARVPCLPNWEIVAHRIQKPQQYFWPVGDCVWLTVSPSPDFATYFENDGADATWANERSPIRSFYCQWRGNKHSHLGA